ncbi:MAG: hypothetical protein H6R43_365 [Nitrospirae bacterium]|nr:hypothetical protein [Nitrospirota bacterium]
MHQIWAGGFDLDRHKIKYIVSTLIDSAPYPSMPPYERMSLLSRLAKICPTLFAAEGCGGDEGMEIGYESSWSGIFPADERVIDSNGYEPDKRCL